MAYTAPSLEHQQIIFDYLRGDIDRNLRECGVDVILQAEGATIPQAGNEICPNGLYSKIVVSREWGYSSANADIDIDLDPQATVMSAAYRVGIAREIRRNHRVIDRSYSGHIVAESLMGGGFAPVGIGVEMTEQQLAVVQQSIDRLVTAKQHAFLVALTRSLLKLDYAGD